MSRVKNRQFWESAKYNNESFMLYYQRLVELSISMFEWKNLPDTIDERFLELSLFGDGMAVFFKDKFLKDSNKERNSTLNSEYEGSYLALRTMIGGHLNVYNIPNERRAYAANGYNFPLDETNSVIIFNNMLHTNSVLLTEYYAKRLWDYDRTIDVNVKAQKTPILIQCDETERLTMINLYKKYDGNEPYIYGTKSLDPKKISVLKTDAPFIADKIHNLKQLIWNEALTYLGISNTNINKKERLLSSESAANNGATIASRYSRLNARQQACKQINKMFGLDIWCDYREDYQVIVDEMTEEVIGEDGEDNG